MTSIIKVDQIQNTSGTSGLTIDSSGHVLLPKVPAFYVKKTSTQTAVAANELVIWGEELLDQGGNFSSSQFTCPVDGVYFFSVQWLSPSDSNQYDVYLRKNESNTAAGFVNRSRNAGVAGHETTTINYVGDFASGDTVDVVLGVSGHVVYGEGSTWSTFMGYMIG
jgi:hypothetical protein